MWEVAIHVLTCEGKQVESYIEKLKHKNKRQQTAIDAMNNLEVIPEHTKITITRLTNDINERNIEIVKWSEWKIAIETEISKLMSD